MSLQRFVPKSELQVLSEHTRLSIQGARDNAVIAAARVEGITYVTHLALQGMQQLSELQAMCTAKSPLGDERYASIVDTHALTVAHVIMSMGGR